MLLSGKRFNLFEGGARSGKTSLTCCHVIDMCLEFPGLNVLFVRSQHDLARASVMDELNGSFPMTFRQYAPSSWDSRNLNKSEAKYTFGNGSVVKASGVNDKRLDNLLGFEYDIVVFEEASQIPYFVFKGLCGRLAKVTPGFRQQAVCTINPENQGSWVFKTFHELVDYDTRKPLKKPERYCHLLMNPMDNEAHLAKEDPDFLEELQNSTGAYHKRFFKGVYAGISETELFTEALLALAREPVSSLSEMSRFVIALDPAGEKGDASLRGASRIWIKKVNELAETYGIRYVAYESNGVGEHVNLAFPRMQTERFPTGKSKWERAEITSALMSRGKIRFKASGNFDALEAELMKYVGGEWEGDGSPDRSSALFVAVRALMSGIDKKPSPPPEPINHSVLNWRHRR